MGHSGTDLPKLLQELNTIGVALSAETDQDKLLEMILSQSRKLTNADGGTLYSRTENDELKFEILFSESLKLHLGGKSEEKITFPPLPLHDDKGKPNNHMVAACAALSGETINIPDAYSDQHFDFTGTRKFDKKTGYRSESFLTVPMRDHENEIIGVLQLINARDPETGKTMPFSSLDQQIIESLASQAAVAITNKTLIREQKELFEAFIQLIANAIDEKSPYTAGHCRRVPVLTRMIAEATCQTQVGPLSEFDMSDEDMYELDIAGWLHDCGKITTPEYVVDKSTKLETIYDRVKDVDSRFEILRRDREIAALKRKLAENNSVDVEQSLLQDEAYQQGLSQLESDREFIHTINVGGEFMEEAYKQRVNTIAGYQWQNHKGEAEPFLSEEETYNLCIDRGTLTAEERFIINNHMAITINMLESLPYPRNLKRVPEYAGGHHEKMDGSGYPKGLTRDQMSIPARMMAIADVFEALTASDRPYKKAMPLSVALRIMGRMRMENHIDPDLFDTFLREKVYLRYAKEFLDEEQIDEFDLATIPGCSAEPATA